MKDGDLRLYCEQIRRRFNQNTRHTRKNDNIDVKQRLLR